MPSRYTDRIVEHLAHTDYTPAPPREVAADMQVRDEDWPQFEQAVRQLEEDERVLLGEDGRLRLPAYGKEVVGTIRINPRGFGFVVPEKTYREGDLFIPPDAVRDAISGDRVRAAVVHRQRRKGSDRGGRGRSRTFGRVVEVIERGQEHFVGVLVREGKNWFVQPDGRALSEHVLIRDPEAKNARPGDKVVIELLHYPEGDYMPEGVIVRVLGEAGRPDVETEAVIAAHGLRTDFGQPVLEEARRAAREFGEEVGEEGGERAGAREDLTGTFTFTIDPPDARDFDDAISISYDAGDETWTLGVHIADVSHFVRQGSALDEEARLRGNSVYLPRLVIPMLPEVLSNGVCSLQEGVPRLARSAFMTFDGRGRPLDQRVCSSVIASRKRLTYIEAQALIDGDQHAAAQHTKTEPHYTDELIEQLRLADRLARTLRKRRLREGMIVLDLPEVELVFDDEGHVVDAVPEDDSFTHTVIEMFMVEANEAVARLFSSLDVPLLRRIHPDPVHGDLEELRMYARVAKYRLPETPTRHDLQRLLEATRGTPASRAIHFAVLRTLTRATYSPNLMGHYALGSDHYAHFTSPIRRYPDLSVHRVIHAYLDATDNGRSVPGGRGLERLRKELRQDHRVLDEGALLELGRHCTETENEAEAAERDLREFLVMQLLHEHHLGDEFTGVITAVTGRGVFVSLERFLVEGLVKMEDLPGDASDRWKVRDQTGRLTSRRTGLSLGVGDIVTVQVAAVDVPGRHIDLRMKVMPAPNLDPPLEPVPAGGNRKRGKKERLRKKRRRKR